MAEVGPGTWVDKRMFRELPTISSSSPLFPSSFLFFQFHLQQIVHRVGALRANAQVGDLGKGYDMQ